MSDQEKQKEETKEEVMTEVILALQDLEIWNGDESKGLGYKTHEQIWQLVETNDFSNLLIAREWTKAIKEGRFFKVPEVV